MIKFSLIMATYGRDVEIVNFFESICKQKLDSSEIEIIVVDQNNKINLDDICQKFSKNLNIVHIKSDKKGLSHNRNIGLKSAKGKFIAFPDDDCRYYTNTLVEVEKHFNKYNDIDMLLGKIYDRNMNKNIIRNWKNHEYQVNIYNFFMSYSSITIFSRKNSILFDDKLGVGTFFGSYEDADYILQSINNNQNIKYIPDIEVWHPDLSANIMSDNKIYSYGLGFGAFVRKNLSFPMIYILIQVIGFHFIHFLYGVFSFKKITIKKRYLSIKSRIKGFYLYDTK